MSARAKALLNKVGQKAQACLTEVECVESSTGRVIDVLNEQDRIIAALSHYTKKGGRNGNIDDIALAVRKYWSSDKAKGLIHLLEGRA